MVNCKIRDEKSIYERDDEDINKNKIFICFIGLDGSGKSTLINSIKDFLKSKNIQILIRWGAYDQWILRPIIKIFKYLLLKNSEPYKNYNDYHESISNFSNSSVKSKIFQTLILFEYKIEIFIKIRIPLFFGKNIILDRYVYDTATNLAVNLNFDLEKHCKLISKLLQNNPRPDLVFFIDIPEEVSMNRKDDIPSIDYLRKRRVFYKNIQNKFNNFIVLNALKTKSDLANEVIEAISSYYSI